MKTVIRKIFNFFFLRLFPEARFLTEKETNTWLIRSSFSNSEIEQDTKLCSPSRVLNAKIGRYTYIAQNSYISETTIGKFCSIGPNFLCGWGIHPLNGISTSPMFYSTMKQNGTTLSQSNKVEERKNIVIGNDVFIGANVVVLDGVTIGNGAVIGAGAVVSKNIPPYAIAIGVPIQILKYRMTEEQRNEMLKIKWWEFDDDKLKNVEKYFFDIDKFISDYQNN